MRKVDKVTVTVTVETFSVDSVQHKLYEMRSMFEAENLNGELTSADGDSVKWETKIEQVEM